MKNYALYTAFSKGYDVLQPRPAHWHTTVDCTAFLEEKPRNPVPGWQIKPLDQSQTDPCRKAKIHKILSHVYFPDHEYTLWVDGCIAITTPFYFADLIEDYLGRSDIVVFKHRRRQCIYAEAKECIAQKKDAPAVIRRQMKMYRADGYPEDNGLIEGCVILRRHSRKIIRFNEMWYDIITRYSRRDQLSFNYVAHQLKMKVRYWPGNYSFNPHFTYKAHTDYVPPHLRPKNKKSQRPPT